jgi:hypothetical protein
VDTTGCPAPGTPPPPRRDRQRLERLDVGRRTGRPQQRGAEGLRLGHDQRDRHALDGDADGAVLALLDERHDRRQRGEPPRDRPRFRPGAHHGQVLARVAPAPDVAGHRPVERFRDRTHELASAVEQQPAPRPRVVRARQRLQQLGLGRGPDSGRGSQPPGGRGLAEVRGGPDAERPRDPHRPLGTQPEEAAEADEIRGELALELGELRDRARLDQLAQLGLDARADPRNCRARPARTRSATGAGAPRTVSPARRYARIVYGFASASSSSAASDSNRSAICAFSMRCGRLPDPDVAARRILRPEAIVERMADVPSDGAPSRATSSSATATPVGA